MTKVYVLVFGNTLNSHRAFLQHLCTSCRVQEVISEQEADVVMAFVPIVSRAGTDIAVALQEIPAGRPVVLVVLHHTLDPHSNVLDSSRIVNREGVFTVDCLFHEDRGLLRCSHNQETFQDVKRHLEATRKVQERQWELMVWITAILSIITFFPQWLGNRKWIPVIILVVIATSIILWLARQQDTEREFPGKLPE